MVAQLVPPKPPLTDGVVALRPFHEADVPAILVGCSDPETRRWIPMLPSPYGRADAERYVLTSLENWDTGSSAELAIVEPASDRLLGSIGLHPAATPHRYAVGYWVTPAARGQGVATRALRLVSRWAFAELPLQRLALWTLPGNRASQRVAERAGFRYEGILRAADSDRDGNPVDCVMFALTRDDLADAPAPGPVLVPAEETVLAAIPTELLAPGSRVAPFVDLVAAGELGRGTMRRVTIAGLDLLIAHTTAGIVVTDDRCPHMAAPLSIGALDDCVVACPLHEGRFDLCTGDTVRMPTTGGLDADGAYHAPWSPTGSAPRAEPASKKLEARRLTRVGRLRYYPTRIRDGRLEAQVPFVPD